MKLYHAVLNRDFQNTWKLVLSVIQNGLQMNDNKEVGNVIWFSPTTEYVYNNNFAVSIEVDKFGYGENEFDITYDGGTAWAHKPIPFNKLTVEKIPIVTLNDGRMTLTNKDLIVYATNTKWRYNTSQSFAELFNKKIVFDDNELCAELFERYVAPYINFEFDLNLIKGDKTKVIHLPI